MSTPPFSLPAASGPLVHGGPDAGPPVRLDFSTNAHPLGPTPSVQAAVQAASRQAYPDPAYHALSRTLAAFHGVDPARIVLGASASELIWRLTLNFSRCAPSEAPVIVEPGTFGEYAHAAAAWGRRVVPPSVGLSGAGAGAGLRWLCHPDNPSGACRSDEFLAALAQAQADTPWPLVMDLAYQPFAALSAPDGGGTHPGRLGSPWADQVVQLWSPNKLHGLTGVRGAYLVWPARPAAAAEAARLRDLAPSWVLGADGVALLEAHCAAAAWVHLREVQPALQRCKAAQDTALRAAGWQLLPSPLHFGLACPPTALSAASPVAQARARRWHAHLRVQGIKLRQAESFGWPGWVRLCARPPADVAALLGHTRAFLDTDLQETE